MCLPEFVPRRFAYVAAAGLLLIALVAAGLLSGRGGREPEYDGRPLGFWVQQQVPSSTNPLLPVALSDEGANAVRQIGTNGLPMLIHWMSYPERSLRERMFQWLSRKPVSPAVWNFAHPRSYRPDFGILGIRALGPQARAAIPALVKLVGKKQDAQWAVLALCAIGPEGTAGLNEALERIDDGSARGNVLLQLQHGIWPERQADVAPLLTGRLTGDPSAGARMSAAMVLRNFTNAAALVVPALARAMHDRDGGVRFTAAESLGHFGAEASPAVPTLEAALSDENPTVRASATQALHLIRQIGGAGNEKAR